MKMLVINLLALLAMLSCKKEGLPDPPPCSTCETDTLLVWQKDLDTLSGQESLFANPILYKGNPIFMIHDGWDCNFGSANRVTCLDAESGEKLWGFDIEEDCKEIYGGFIYQDYLVLNIPNQVLCYDLKTMTNQWIFDLPAGVAGSVGFLGINDKVYLSATTGPQMGEETAFLYEITVANGQVREISHFYKDDWGASPVIHPPSLWIDPTSGDSLLVVAVGLYKNQGPFDDRQSLHAYDLKTGTFRWQVDSIGIPTNNNKRMEVYDNKVYVPTDWRIHCFDAFTGTRIWEAEMPNNTQQIDFSYSRPFAIKGKLIANSTSEEMYCFDAFTGQLLWSVPKFTARANHDLIEYNNIVYLSAGGNGRFVGVDLESGEILLNISSPNLKPSFAGYNIVLNEEKNLLFLNDYKTAYGYKPFR